MTDKANHLVSVIIPTQNRRHLLERAVQSVQNQSYSPLEIIVVNDGSTDDTHSFMSNLQQKYPKTIRYFTYENPQGAPKARNRGISEATGEFITFLDDDDELLPDNIHECMEHYSDNYAYVCTGYRRITPQKITSVIPKKIITLDAMLYKIVTGNQILVRKERVLELGGFDESLLSSQDYDLWLRLNERYGNSNCVRKPLIIMHAEHEHNRITTSSSKIRGELAFYNKHKNKMNLRQKKYQLFYIIKLKRKKISLCKFFSLVPIRHIWPDIKYYLLINFPRLKDISKQGF